MKVEDLTVVVPKKEVTTGREEPVAIWPLIDAALQKIEADDLTRDAARAALSSSDGCAVLANYLHGETPSNARMDYRFKVPLLVLAAELAQDDGGADVIYDPEEGILFFETDDAQYAFPVHHDWIVDWEQVADEVIKGYEWVGVNDQIWSLDRLLSYMDLGQPRTFGGD